jgi:hypothetical protein
MTSLQLDGELHGYQEVVQTFDQWFDLCNSSADLSASKIGGLHTVCVPPLTGDTLIPVFNLHSYFPLNCLLSLANRCSRHPFSAVVISRIISRRLT